MIRLRTAGFVSNQSFRRNFRDSISSLLLSLKWPTLQLHRESTRLILLYKIINPILQSSANYLPTPSPITTTRSKNDMKFLHHQPITDCFQYSFSPPEWSYLPSDIVHAILLDSFKNLLHNYYNMQLYILIVLVIAN